MKFSKELYPKIALIKSAYAFTDRAYIHLDADEDYYYVEASPKPEHGEVDEGEFIDEMMCQCARHEVYLQTKDLRELLVARAMASTVIQSSAERAGDEPAIDEGEPSGEGLARDADAARRILKDWFDDDAYSQA